ncbi:MAG: hypothetical protein H7X93_10520, partial [Sphingomonadaceae bacterium]|nr:hypothetical protein [Sphingomonadaceae bacterium]
MGISLRNGMLAGAAAIAVALSVVPGLAQSAARPVWRAPAIGSFTPASADPRMADVIRRQGISRRGMRFTPSSAATR